MLSWSFKPTKCSPTFNKEFRHPQCPPRSHRPSSRSWCPFRYRCRNFSSNRCWWNSEECNLNLALMSCRYRSHCKQWTKTSRIGSVVVCCCCCFRMRLRRGKLIKSSKNAIRFLWQRFFQKSFYLSTESLRKTFLKLIKFTLGIVRCCCIFSSKLLLVLHSSILGV